MGLDGYSAGFVIVSWLSLRLTAVAMDYMFEPTQASYAAGNDTYKDVAGVSGMLSVIFSAMRMFCI